MSQNAISSEAGKIKKQTQASFGKKSSTLNSDVSEYTPTGGGLKRRNTTLINGVKDIPLKNGSSSQETTNNKDNVISPSASNRMTAEHR